MSMGTVRWLCFPNGQDLHQPQIETGQWCSFTFHNQTIHNPPHKIIFSQTHLYKSWHSGATWRHRPGWTLAQMMACYVMGRIDNNWTNTHLSSMSLVDDNCIVNGQEYNWLEGEFVVNAHGICPWYEFENESTVAVIFPRTEALTLLCRVHNIASKLGRTFPVVVPMPLFTNMD